MNLNFSGITFCIVICFLTLTNGVYSQNSLLSGTVKDVSGTPLIGVNIVQKGTTNGTITDVDGKFTLSLPLNSVIVFSYIGFITQDIEREGRSTLNVILHEDSELLNEVVVIGYGSIRKRDFTGSVGSLDGENLTNIPSSNIGQNLQGRIPGVFVSQNNGSPGAQSKIRIRGGNSIKGSNDPLYVIDGFIVGTDFNLNNINSNNIKSIEVLKDATSIGIYGSRGANGVILITTKDGKEEIAGKPKVSINTYYGIQSQSNKMEEIMNGEEYATFVNEFDSYRGVSETYQNISTIPNTNWIDLVTRQNSPIYNADLSISGQSIDKKIGYSLSGNYFNQAGIILNSGFERYNFSSNINIDLNNRLKTGVRLTLSQNYRNNNKVNFTGVYKNLTPTREVYEEDGSYTGKNPTNGNIQGNPLADVNLKINNTITTKLFGNFFLEYKPSRKLTFLSTIGPDIYYRKDNIYNPSTLPDYKILNTGGDASIENRKSISLLNENTISYNTSIKDVLRFVLLGGFTWQTYQMESSISQGYGYQNDAVTFNNIALGADPLRNIIGSGWDSFQLLSWLGRINLSLKDKYQLSLVTRMDGSSKFATTNNKYAMFPSVGLAWNIDREEFFKNISMLNVMKLRASYGKSGSEAINSYRTLAVLNGKNAYFNNTSYSGVVYGRPENENLKWETTTQFNAGLEIAAFNNKLNIELDYYDKLTTDLLLDVQIPHQTGYNQILQNRGEIRNKGIEFKLNTLNINKKNFTWSSTLALSGNRNKVLDLGDVDFIDIAEPISGGPSARLMVGKPAPVFVGLEYLGTWNSQEEIDESGQKVQEVGGPHFHDLNGDGNITVEDFGVIGNPEPKLIGGLQNILRWKNFTLDFYLEGTYGNDIYNILSQSMLLGRSESNKFKEVINRWTPENMNSIIPRAGTVETLASVKSNTIYIEDGSHLRLKNLTLSYNVPVSLLNWNWCEKMNIYITGNNLFLLSNFRLGDPETDAYGSNNIVYGFSEGEYPYARNFSLGFNLTF